MIECCQTQHKEERHVAAHFNAMPQEVEPQAHLVAITAGVKGQAKD